MIIKNNEACALVKNNFPYCNNISVYRGKIEKRYSGIYIITFSDGTQYIGKSRDMQERIRQQLAQTEQGGSRNQKVITHDYTIAFIPVDKLDNETQKELDDRLFLIETVLMLTLKAKRHNEEGTNKQVSSVMAKDLKIPNTRKVNEDKNGDGIIVYRNN